ncbi:MAG: hypothetical protein P4L84_06690 [Isosphaeraceae bacterium]|nr:hypothetical protein [Isosphaeraceae bacterium]
MKKVISSALVLSLLSFTSAGLVGCGEESKVENKEVVKTPEGTTTTTKSEKIESSGSNPPANSAGEKAK